MFENYCHSSQSRPLSRTGKWAHVVSVKALYITSNLVPRLLVTDANFLIRLLDMQRNAAPNFREISNLVGVEEERGSMYFAKE